MAYTFKRLSVLALTAGLAIGYGGAHPHWTTPASAADYDGVQTNDTTNTGDERDVIAKAQAAANQMIGNRENTALRSYVKSSRAIMIIPNFLKAGFFLGGSGGTGVLLEHKSDGSWSAPAFYLMSGASFGLQFGAEQSEVILTIMTEKGLNAILNDKVKLGADASLAIADLGGGAQAATGLATNADMYAFADTNGLFAGVSLDGSVITSRQEWNTAFYGQGATPHDILAEARYDRSDVNSLRAALP